MTRRRWLALAAGTPVVAFFGLEIAAMVYDIGWRAAVLVMVVAGFVVASLFTALNLWIKED